MSIAAATDGAVFHAYLERVLLPELRRAKPDAVLVMDNLSAHKTKAGRGLLDASGCAYRYRPPSAGGRSHGVMSAKLTGLPGPEPIRRQRRLIRSRRDRRQQAAEASPPGPR